MFNGVAKFAGKPVKLADLKVDDRVEVHHTAGDDENRRVATELDVRRLVDQQGTIRDIDLKKSRLTFALDGAEQEHVSLPFAEQCDIILNGQAKIDQRLLKPADLKPGDKVTVKHDDHVVAVDAYRVLHGSGVIQRIAEGTIDVLRGRQRPDHLSRRPQVQDHTR